VHLKRGHSLFDLREKKEESASKKKEGVLPIGSSSEAISLGGQAKVSS